MSDDRPVGCPIEFNEIFDWDEEAAEKASLRRYFDDEIFLRALYLFPCSWFDFMPEGFPVVGLLGKEFVFSGDMMDRESCRTRGSLACGVWIPYAANRAVIGMVNSDTD